MQGVPGRNAERIRPALPTVERRKGAGMAWIACTLAAALVGGFPAAGADEAALIQALERGPAQARVDACRQLARVGTRRAVPALAGLLGDPALSHWARIALEATPGPEASAALRAELSRLTGSLRAGIITSLGVRRDVAAVPVLARLLRNPDAQTAAAAAHALGRIGTPAASAALEQAAAKAPAGLGGVLDPARLDCADALLAAGHRRDAREVFDRLRAARTASGGRQGPSGARSARAPSARSGRPVESSPSAAVRAGAVRGAIASRGAEGAALLLQVLREGDAVEAGAALWAACRHVPGSEVTGRLAGALPSLSVERRTALILALGGRGDRAAVPALQSAASSGPSGVRVAAVRALGMLGGVQAAATLAGAAAESDAEVALAAREGLSHLSTTELKHVVGEMLASNEPASRRAGISLIHGRRMPGFAPRLVVAAHDPDPETRRQAVRALGDLAGMAELPALLDLAAASDPAESAAGGEAAARACSRLGDPERCAGLIADRLERAGPAGRASLVRVLESVGGARALAAVRAALKDADPGVRAAALNSLCGWPTADAAADLLSLARGGEDPAQRLTALRGVLRLAGDEAVPVERRLALCAEAADLSVRPEERRLWLAALGGVPDPAALALIAPHIGDSMVSEEACAAAVSAARRLLSRSGGRPDLAKEAAAIRNALLKAAAHARDSRLAGEAKALAETVVSSR